LTGGAGAIATVMFVIFRNTFRSATQFNIDANLGKTNVEVYLDCRQF
jgi:hypothetical protein